MRDYYAIQVLNPSPALKADLTALGFHAHEYKEKRVEALSSTSLTSTLKFQISIDDQRLPDLIRLNEKYRCLSAYLTEFDENDFAQTTWLEAEITSWIGYPKPENSWQEVTYDLADHEYCRHCGLGRRQVNPFRLARSHPRGKTVSFCAPGWVHDALFITLQVRETLLATGTEGIRFMPAIEAGSKVPFADVIQLLVDQVLEPGLLNGDDFAPEICSYCQRKKYVPYRRVKRYRHDALPDQVDLIMTHEWFGSGGMAFRKILVSRRFAELYREQRWRGLRLSPVVLE